MDHPWRVFVDTGGTFTDAVATGPDGRVRHAKVLSQGGLRGTIEEDLGEGRLRVFLPVPLPEGFLRGFGFRVLGDTSGEEAAPRVTGHDAASGILRMDRSREATCRTRSGPIRT